MKKRILTLAAIGTLLSAQTLSAALLPYNDYRDLDVIDEVIGDQGLSGELNIASDDFDSISYDIWGFDGVGETIKNVALAFSFYELTDGGRNWARVDFKLGDTDLIEDSSVALGVGVPSLTLNFDYILDSATLSTDVAMTLIADIQADGKIDWSVFINADDENANDIYLFAAVLGVEVEQVPDSVSTFATLGLCLFGLYGFKRRASN